MTIAAEATPAVVQDVGGGNRPAVLVTDPARTDRCLVSRLLLGLVLAAVSVLIPGEGDRFLEAPVDWSDLLPAHRRSPVAPPRATSSAASSIQFELLG